MHPASLHMLCQLFSRNLCHSIIILWKCCPVHLTPFMCVQTYAEHSGEHKCLKVIVSSAFAFTDMLYLSL